MDFNRQLSVLDPGKIYSKRIDLIGVGATGSYIAWLLSKIGAGCLHLWDGDEVSDVNICNQMFREDQVGRPKVLAVSEMIKAGSGIKANMHMQMIEGKEELGEIVFLLTDSMSSRQAIWDSCIKGSCSLMIETRMGADEGRVYAVDPKDEKQCAWWEATLCKDEEAQVSACGTSMSIAPTAALVASVAVWQLIKYLNEDYIEHGLVFTTKNFNIFEQKVGGRHG